MDTRSELLNRPLGLERSAEATVYALLGVAFALTAVGVFVGMLFFEAIFSSGMHIALLIAELAILFTANLWVRRSPLNMLLFGLFPFLSGLTFAPYVIAVLAGYANGGSILLNALLSTALMVMAAAICARGLGWNLSSIGGSLFFALIGLIILSLLQLFIPGLRTTGFELLLSGIGIVLFSLFTAYDLQRMRGQLQLGMSPFLIALSLYLDIYNLFLSILRFMMALSGQRR